MEQFRFPVDVSADRVGRESSAAVDLDTFSSVHETDRLRRSVLPIGRDRGSDCRVVFRSYATVLVGFDSSRGFMLRCGLVGFVGSTIHVSPQCSHS